MMSAEYKSDTLLMQIAQKYASAIREWKADRVNPFKDGHMLGIYEGKSLVLNELDEGRTLNEIVAQLKARLQRAKQEWARDRMNPYKDGKLLAWFELVSLAEAAA
ncbi:MAG: hypothetical protein E7317_01905 [Clostridiales bacterium]|nr:hypothetical protein [Clostridiales bacterium]